MGNRAVVSFTKSPKAPSVYLHWNGGRASVEGILQAMRDTRCVDGRTPEVIADAFACAAVAFIGGSTYVGTADKMDCDNFDNGQYFVDTKTLTIASREYTRGAEEVDAKKTAHIANECATAIRAAMANEPGKTWADLRAQVQPN
jgi:hypothetical protein